MTSNGIDRPAPPNVSTPIKCSFFSEFVQSVHNWDSQHSLRIHQLGLRLPRFFLHALEYSGDGLFWISITTAVCWAPYFTLQPFFKSLFIGFMFDLAFIGTIKALIRRPRPVYNKGMYLILSVDHFSFPSGHSSRAFLIFTFVLKYASAWKPILFQATRGCARGRFEMLVGYYLILIIFACWATATATSRILLGRHFVLDVVVGSFLGVLEALFVMWTLLPLQFFLDDQQRWILECGHKLKEVVLKLV